MIITMIATMRAIIIATITIAILIAIIVTTDRNHGHASDCCHLARPDRKFNPFTKELCVIQAKPASYNGGALL